MASEISQVALFDFKSIFDYLLVFRIFASYHSYPYQWTLPTPTFVASLLGFCHMHNL